MTPEVRAGRMTVLFDRLRQWAKQLTREVYALWFACRDPRTPWYARVVAACTVAYALSPLDLIPDPIPVLGYLDDLLLVPLGLALARKLIPTEVMADARARARAQEYERLPANWTAGSIIIAVWLLVAYSIVHLILHRR